MSDLPATQASLLLRIRDPRDGGAWQEFVDLYAPVVYRFLCKQGLQDADSADLTQEVLTRIAGVAATFNYDPRQGSFRGWLFTIVRNRLRDWLENRQRRIQGSGDTSLHEYLGQLPGREDELSQLWEREFEQRLFQAAAEQAKNEFQDSTWQAFWRTTVEGAGTKETAQFLGISVAAVYLARSRVMARLKEIIHPWQEI